VYVVGVFTIIPQIKFLSTFAGIVNKYRHFIMETQESEHHLKMSTYSR